MNKQELIKHFSNMQNKFICELDHCFLTNSHYYVYGETIGEAVCRATVEYLKRRKELVC